MLFYLLFFCLLINTFLPYNCSNTLYTMTVCLLIKLRTASTYIMYLKLTISEKIYIVLTQTSHVNDSCTYISVRKLDIKNCDPDVAVYVNIPLSKMNVPRTRVLPHENRRPESAFRTKLIQTMF